MSKAKSILFILAATGVIYILITLIMPVINTVVGETDTALVARSANVTTTYPGSKEALDYMPWLLYLIPGFIAVIATVIVLRRQDTP